MFGFRIIAQDDRLGAKLIEHRCQHLAGHRLASCDGVAARHEHLGFDDRDQSGFLAECGVAG